MWFGARVACHRLRRQLDWSVHPRPWAITSGKPEDFPLVVASHSSPLQRAPDGAIAAYSEEKAHNLRLATAKVNNLIIAPGEVFSFCRTVGKTTRRKGYLPALEMHEGKLLAEVGGGLCQLSNLLLLLSLDINAETIERHRHAFDLFRDVDRTVPFGLGATVFYNYVDFQFRNTLAFPVLLNAGVDPPLLRAEIRAREPLAFTIKIRETDHHFFRREGTIYRANRLWKEIDWREGHPPTKALLFTNECRVLYPAEDLVTENDER
jgi:vancomycin resistance protein VanW